ncbi:MAG: acetylxylan esterase [Verrucomicrobia bacterium]|nr:acetylxylan esterase [Verrucomicrobiota bacterium]
MRTLALLLIVAGVPSLVFVQGASLPSALPVIDGKIDDPFWRSLAEATLTPDERGVPATLGGTVRTGVRSGYLCVAATLPEPGGRVQARSFGRNPIWEIDATGSPSVEDRIEFRIESAGPASATRSVIVAVNPWGAYRIEEGGAALDAPGVLPAAAVTATGWTVELAVPLATLGVEARQPAPLRLRATRFRARRPLAPEFRWSWPAGPGYSEVRIPGASSEAAVGPASPGSATSRGQPAAGFVAPQFRPPIRGNNEPPLEIGCVPQLPPVVADWDHPAWRDTPAFALPRNEPAPRAPRHPTRVKWMHDGRTLALLVYVTEPEPVVARAGGRDSAVTSDDHVALYLATSGSAFLEIAVNAVGAIRDSRGRGPRSMTPQSGWNADILAQTDVRHGAWIARINVPLDQCAAALGESRIPRDWRILVARTRAARPGDAAETSALPPIGTVTFHGPIRYRRMVLGDLAPSTVATPAPAHQPPPAAGLASELAALESNVWSPLHRRFHQVRTMVQRQQLRRAGEAVWQERQEWNRVQNRGDWERFREPRLRALATSLGQFPPDKPPLDVRAGARHDGDGYRLENLVYQSRPGFYVTANLYLPARPSPPLPAMIIVHSQHYPKTQGELHDMGELWARTGAAVLIMERPGYGERAETSTWFRQAYASRHTFTKQLFLVGESHSGWAAWDIMRSVDYLCARPDIDQGRIILLGSVAGGGEPAGVAAALDPRIAAVVPFNYDQGHIRVHGDTPGQIAGQFSPWLVAASVAPRRFVRAFEFGWEGAEEADYPTLWVDGMERSARVWGFYAARDNLATSQAYGLIRLSMERVSHCFSIGPQQRKDLYPIFNRWFGLPLPSEKDLSILPDSELSVSAVREEARQQELERRRPHADLLSISPGLSADLPRRPLHQIAHAMGERQLAAARSARRTLAAAARRERLRADLRPMLGDIEPAVAPPIETTWTHSLAGAEAEALSLEVEDGIRVPLLLLRPAGRSPAPVVVAVTQQGKERWLQDRSNEIGRLLQAGIAVCLPDVRGTGETAPAVEPRDGGPRHAMAQMEFDLGKNLLGARLRDLRTVLVYLRTRSDIDGGRMALWGESFAPPNAADLFLDELEFEAGPQIQYRAETIGAHLALLAPLFDEGIQAVAASGGLAGYLGMLESPFTYVPIEDVILGVLKAGDIADVAAALAPRPLLLEGAVNGRNIRLDAAGLNRIFLPAREAYRDAAAPDRLTLRPEPGDAAAWLIEGLK